MDSPQYRYVFDERFAESFLHSGRHRVMGMELEPFSFWHKLQLEYWNSAVLVGNPTLWDVWVAAKVCQSRYPEQARVRARYAAVWQVWWWMRNVLIGRRRLDSEMEAFIGYLREYNSPPKLWSGKGSSYRKLAEAYRDLSAVGGEENREEALRRAMEFDQRAETETRGDRDIDDGLEQIAAYCKGGRSPAEAWNMPMGELVWMNVAFAKSEGAKVPIWTPEDDARMEEQKVKRSGKIAELAKEIEQEEGVSSREAIAWAGVKYWEGVVAQVAKG